ncbi:MAG TPA: SDR family NAD(P)-dependent oxidoreductase [Methylomirabilota bacterium]|nr:SDR family NAD(P)-dependent oxidoreductase [Methylomirabilota bacterium]
MLEFKDQVVLVTGGGAGIGLGIAQAFHRAGAKVAIGDLREPSLHRAAERLGPARVFVHPVDVRDGGSVDALVGAAERALGPITVAVANAGIYPNCPVLEMTVEEWDRVMETNMRGVFLTCQAVGRRMVAQGTPGKIITISSGAYQSGRKGAAHYCASKAGVVMFTRVLAMELAPHRVNVNCIAPGLITVDRDVSQVSDEYVSTLVATIPWSRPGTPEDIANAALFLASPLADFITGETLSVDGGSATGRTWLPYSRPASG